MARKSNQAFRIRSRGGVAYLDTFIGRERVRESLHLPLSLSPSAEEARAAQEAAARRYTKLISGRVVARRSRVLTDRTLDETFAAFLDAIETPRNANSIDTYAGYGRTYARFAEHRLSTAKLVAERLTAFEHLVADEGPIDFAMWRLNQVLRKTVRKELVTLFRFLHWAKLRRLIAEVPPRPTLPKNEPGIRSGKQRQHPVDLTPDEVAAWVSALPERSPGRRGRSAGGFPVRAPILLQWVTGLRPTTIAKLSVPEDWTRGAVVLHIRDEIDKSLFGRDLPLAPAAIAILDAYAPERGLIFGRHDYRKHLRAAAIQALGLDKGKRVARYDLRHGRAIDWLERSGGNLAGVAYLLGHKQVTTTNIYTRPRERLARSVLDAGGDVFSAGGGDSVTRASQRPAPALAGGEVSLSDPTLTGRGEWIRTTDPQTPSPARSRDPYAFLESLTSHDDRERARTKADAEILSHDLSHGLGLLSAGWDLLELAAAGAEAEEDRS